MILMCGVLMIVILIGMAVTGTPFWIEENRPVRDNIFPPLAENENRIPFVWPEGGVTRAL